MLKSTQRGQQCQRLAPENLTQSSLSCCLRFGQGSRIRLDALVNGQDNALDHAIVRCIILTLRLTIPPKAEARMKAATGRS